MREGALSRREQVAPGVGAGELDEAVVEPVAGHAVHPVELDPVAFERTGEGEEIESVPGDRRVGGAAAVDLHRHPVLLDVGAGDVRIGGEGVAFELDAPGLGPADHRFLLGHVERRELAEIVHPALGEHDAAARARPFGDHRGLGARGVVPGIGGAVLEVDEVARFEVGEPRLLELQREVVAQRRVQREGARDVLVLPVALEPDPQVALGGRRDVAIDAVDGLEIAQIGGDGIRRQNGPQPASERDDDPGRPTDAAPRGVERRCDGPREASGLDLPGDAIFQESVVARGFVEDGALGGVGDHWKGLPRGRSSNPAGARPVPVALRACPSIRCRASSPRSACPPPLRTPRARSHRRRRRPGTCGPASGRWCLAR